MNSSKKPVHVIAHTHWDRSWYWPLERFRVKLVECVKAVVRELKARPDYQFNFDGQIVMLEDYLQVCPEDRPYLQQAAREGRIIIGPMYSLADVYCTGGEALIRNILIGEQFCEEFSEGAGYSRVLHMPDTFGITPSMPMIAEGFGFKAFTFMRGVAGQTPGLHDMQALQGVEPQIPEGTRFFKWRTPDGSEVVTIRLRHGYASAAAIRFFERETGTINYDRYVELLLEAAQKWDEPSHEVVLLMAGVDHMIPWDGQGPAMDEATEKGTYAFKFSNLEAAADQLRSTDLTDLPVCDREFHGNGAASVLGGTLSSRVYLKQNNAEIEQLLVNQVEPVAALGRLLGRIDPAENLIHHAWKTLLVTHPHDDICGCSVDAVHRKNESDMEQARQSADAIRRRVFFQLMSHYGMNRRGDNRPSFALFNTQGATRTGPAPVQFDFEGQIEWGDIALPDHYRIVNEAGEPVPFREVERGQSVEHPRKVVRIEIYAPLKPFVPERFYLEEIGDAPSPTTDHGFQAENGHFTVSLHENGAFDLTDKQTGKTHSGLGLFSSQADIGDSYDFSDIPEERETIFDSLNCRLSRKEWSGGVTELVAEGELELPASTDPVSRTRDERLVQLPFRQTLVIAPDLNEVEVRLEFTNTAADHRLRWNLPLAESAETSLAGLKFNPARRPAGERPPGNEAPRIFPEHPADHFAAASDLALFSRFPFNYELVADAPGEQRLAATVFRSFSYLTNPNQGATRKGIHAGPHTLTPEGRCLGRRFSMSFAVRPVREGDPSELFHHAALWRALPLAGQIDATTPFPWRDSSSNEEDQPPIRVEGQVIVSTLKPAESGDGVVLRLFNATDSAQTASIEAQGCRLQPARLDETPDGSPAESGKISLKLPPFALRSLSFGGKLSGTHPSEANY